MLDISNSRVTDERVNKVVGAAMLLSFSIMFLAMSILALGLVLALIK